MTWHRVAFKDVATIITGSTPPMSDASNLWWSSAICDARAFGYWEANLQHRDNNIGNWNCILSSTTYRSGISLMHRIIR